MLFCRVTSDRPVARVALVDGSLVRTAGRRGFHLAQSINLFCLRKVMMQD